MRQKDVIGGDAVASIFGINYYANSTDISTHCAGTPFPPSRLHYNNVSRVTSSGELFCRRRAIAEKDIACGGSVAKVGIK